MSNAELPTWLDRRYETLWEAFGGRDFRFSDAVELLGKKLSFGDVELEVRESFYGGRLTTIGEAIEIIRTEATIANLMGTDIVSEAIKAGLIHPDATISIGGVLHAQLIKLTSR